MVLQCLGGITVPTDFPVTWFKFVSVPMTWNEAVNNCEQIGGKLFWDLNGTQEQLQFLHEKMGLQYHWLGIYTNDHRSWMNIDGDVMDSALFLWARGEPNNFKAMEDKVANGLRGANLNDFPPNKQLRSVCDMI